MRVQVEKDALLGRLEGSAEGKAAALEAAAADQSRRLDYRKWRPSPVIFCSWCLMGVIEVKPFDPAQDVSSTRESETELQLFTLQFTWTWSRLGPSRWTGVPV